MKCPICQQEHYEEYLEYSKIRHHEKDDLYKERYYIYVYCKYSDIGASFYMDEGEVECQR